MWYQLFCVFVVAFPGSDCGDSFKEIEGARLYSSYNQLYGNNACTLGFKTDSDYSFTRARKHLRLNFKRFNITDCSVSLKIYHSSNSYGSPNVSVTTCKVIKYHLYIWNICLLQELFKIGLQVHKLYSALDICVFYKLCSAIVIVTILSPWHIV